MAVVYIGQQALKIIGSFVVAWVAITFGLHYQVIRRIHKWHFALIHDSLLQIVTKSIINHNLGDEH